MQTVLADYIPRERVRGINSRTPARYCSGTLWPHGEWSFGYASERSDASEWHEDPYTGMGVDDTDAARGEAAKRLPINLSVPANSCKWPRRGTKGMTGMGQQMVKAAGFLMQRNWPLHRKTLGTITLPPMSEAARRQVVEMWPLLTRELLTWLSRRLRRQGLPPVVVSVTEIQPKRLAESGEGCLHWHLLWLNVPARSGHWSVDPNDIRAWLTKVLLRKIHEFEGGHVNVNTKPVTGAVAGYLAKYMSKGKQMVAEAMTDWGHGLCPRTWWNMTKAARDMVKSSTHRGRHVGDVLQYNLNRGFETNAESHFLHLQKIELEWDGHTYTAGYCGRFTEEVDKYVRWWLKSFDIEGLNRTRKESAECPAIAHL